MSTTLANRKRPPTVPDISGPPFPWDDGELVRELRLGRRRGDWEDLEQEREVMDLHQRIWECLLILTTSVSEVKLHPGPTPLSFPEGRALLRRIIPSSQSFYLQGRSWRRLEEGKKEFESPLHPLTQVLCPSFLQSKVHLWAWRPKWRKRKRAEVTIFVSGSFPVIAKMFLASNIFMSSISLSSAYDALHVCHISCEIPLQGEREKRWSLLLIFVPWAKEWAYKSAHE